MDLDLSTIDLSELADAEPEEQICPGSDKSYRLAKYWHDQLDSVRDEYKKWVKRGTSIERRYRDERAKSDEDSTKRVNNLWANVEILYPALYGRCPVPIAERRFRDKDPVGRGAAQILERALRNELEICGYDEAIGQSVKDYLLSGRGTVWVRYEPEIGPGISIPVEDEMDLRDDQGMITDDDEETESEIKLRDTGDRITRESTPVDYIQWTDFVVFPAKARTWKEVVAVGKRVYMTRDQMLRRFGDKIGKEIPLEKDDRDRKRLSELVSAGDEAGKKGEVYEIWCRADEHVYWIAEGYDYLCDYQEDPLGLECFFPCPRPLFANSTTNTLIPVPDFLQYQDQALQIDELTQRIALLAKACKVAGVYNAAEDGIKRLFDESVENQLIPVAAWAAFAENGGVEGNISLLPLKDIIGCMNELIQVKAQVVQEMDRLTGITDIIRGTTDARETLGAQRLKQNSQGTRLQRRQNEVARFCRDTIKIMAEVMAIHFSPQSLIEVSGALNEEGLGIIEDMSMPGAQAPGAAPPNAGSLLPPAGQAPGLALSPPSTGAGPASSPGAMEGSQQPPQTPGLPMVQSPPVQAGMPQNAPMSPPEPSMGMPDMPPELMAKVEGLKRIAAAIQLLRNEKLRGFRVDIETDSTIFGDSQQEKADRTEFIGGVTKFLQQAGMIAMQMPEATPMLGKVLQFGVRGFRVGRDLETAIEDFCEQAEKDAKKRALNPQPNPEQIKAQAQMAASQAEIQKAHLDAQSNIQNAEFDKQRAEIELQMRQMEMQIKQLDVQSDQQRNQVDMAKITHEQQSSEADHARGIEQTQADMQKSALERDHHTQKLAMEQKSRELEMELKRVEYEHTFAKGQLDMQKAQRDEELATTQHALDMMKQKRELQIAEHQHKQQIDEHEHDKEVTKLQRQQEIEKTSGDHRRDQEAAEADHKRKMGEEALKDSEHKRKMGEELLKGQPAGQTLAAVKTTADTFGKAIEQLVEMAKAMKESVEKLDDIAETMESTAAKTLAPKEIIRDKSGRATGVRTVIQ